MQLNLSIGFQAGIINEDVFSFQELDRLIFRDEVTHDMGVQSVVDGSARSSIFLQRQQTGEAD